MDVTRGDIHASGIYGFKDLQRPCGNFGQQKIYRYLSIYIHSYLSIYISALLFYLSICLILFYFSSFNYPFNCLTHYLSIYFKPVCLRFIRPYGNFRQQEIYLSIFLLILCLYLSTFVIQSSCRNFGILTIYMNPTILLLFYAIIFLFPSCLKYLSICVSIYIYLILVIYPSSYSMYLSFYFWCAFSNLHISIYLTIIFCNARLPNIPWLPRGVQCRGTSARRVPHGVRGARCGGDHGRVHHRQKCFFTQAHTLT